MLLWNVLFHPLFYFTFSFLSFLRSQFYWSVSFLFLFCISLFCLSRDISVSLHFFTHSILSPVAIWLRDSGASIFRVKQSDSSALRSFEISGTTWPNDTASRPTAPANFLSCPHPATRVLFQQHCAVTVGLTLSLARSQTNVTNCGARLACLCWYSSTQIFRRCTTDHPRQTQCWVSYCVWLADGRCSCPAWGIRFCGFGGPYWTILVLVTRVCGPVTSLKCPTANYKDEKIDKNWGKYKKGKFEFCVCCLQKLFHLQH